MTHYPSGRSTFVLRLGLVVVLAVTSAVAQQPGAPPGQAQQPATQPEQTQQPAAPPEQAEQPPRFRTEANYVRVDVYPTRGGVPVRDLRAGDFEVLENGAPQEIRAFEHVVITPAGPQSLRAEADSVRGGEQMAANPRNRVFVFFLDVPHVAVEGSHAIKEPLIRLIDRVLGADDLVAVMTPDMSSAQLTFGRKTQVIADMLREKWYWGVRHSIREMDERERQYDLCYPASPGEASAGMRYSRAAQLMIARRRERMVLDALHDLVRYLGSIREERKAIVTVTGGWALYRPDPSVTQLRVDPRTGKPNEPVPGKPPVGVDEFGKLRIDPPRRGIDEMDGSRTTCDRERMHLASIDNEDYFRYLLDVANRNNASFYPIDPRGLAVFDYPIGPDRPPSLVADMASLRNRIEVLRTLAENTDGLAVVNSNDLDAGLRRIADDLTSYYLLGYYSSNTKLDGTFRRITVRVKRPGVDVRARRGYRAATAEEVHASRAAAAEPVPDHVRTTNAALAALGRIRPEQRFSIHAVPLRATPGGPLTGLWIIGELVGPVSEFAGGSTATIDLAGGASGGTSVSLKPGERAFAVKVPVEATGTAIDVRARLTAPRADEPLSDSARVDVEPALVQPILFRRGLSTGNRLQPAADFRFSRTERLRIELPITADTTPGAGRFLDRNGQPLAVPVQVADRTDDERQRWLTADATLSALGAGDYVVEVSYRSGAAEQKVLTAVRVTR